jgi:hypothetical protein
MIRKKDIVVDVVEVVKVAALEGTAFYEFSGDSDDLGREMSPRQSTLHHGPPVRREAPLRGRATSARGSHSAGTHPWTSSPRKCSSWECSPWECSSWECSPWEYLRKERSCSFSSSELCLSWEWAEHSLLGERWELEPEAQK